MPFGCSSPDIKLNSAKYLPLRFPFGRGGLIRQCHVGKSFCQGKSLTTSKVVYCDRTLQCNAGTTLHMFFWRRGQQNFTNEASIILRHQFSMEIINNFLDNLPLYCRKNEEMALHFLITVWNAFFLKELCGG